MDGSLVTPGHLVAPGHLLAPGWHVVSSLVAPSRTVTE
jgi:hypothetical protein